MAKAVLPSPDSVNPDWPKRTPDRMVDHGIPESGEPTVLGGPGSGHHGHKGVPGQRGGSAPGDGGVSAPVSAPPTSAPPVSAPVSAPASTPAPAPTISNLPTEIRDADDGYVPGDCLSTTLPPPFTLAVEMRRARPATIEDAEDLIRNQTREHGFVFRDGKLIAYAGQDRTSAIGLESLAAVGEEPPQIANPYQPVEPWRPQAVSREEAMSKARIGPLLKDAVFTHNHPGYTGSYTGPRPDYVARQRPPSTMDIAAAAKWNVREMRVVTDAGTHVLYRKGATWDHPPGVVVRAAQHEDIVTTENRARIKQGALTVDQAGANHTSQLWARILGDPEIRKVMGYKWLPRRRS